MPREPFRKKSRKNGLIANQPKRVRGRRPGGGTCRKPFSPSPHGVVHLVQGRLREHVQEAKFNVESYLSESNRCRWLWVVFGHYRCFWTSLKTLLDGSFPELVDHLLHILPRLETGGFLAVELSWRERVERSVDQKMVWRETHFIFWKVSDNR